MRFPRYTIWALGCAAALPLAMRAAGVDAPAAAAGLSGPARDWAADCAKTEALVIEHPGSYLRYRLHEVNQKGDQLRDQIETPEGTVARLIERDGKPLTAEQDRAERERLNAMVSSPSDFARHVRRDDEDKRNGLEMLREMPDAMVWSYAAGQPQLPSWNTREAALVVLDFKPDPKWEAPDMQSELMTGLTGRIWIDPRSRRLIRLEAHVFRSVNVGWGFVAHVYPGGMITLEQVNAGGERWIVRHMEQQFMVRALLLKSVRQQARSDTSEYRAVPAMKYQDAIKMLLETPLPH